MLGFAMTSDDWLKLGMAVIGSVQVIVLALIGLGAAWLQWKLNKGEKLVNGRMDQMRQDLYRQGFNDGHAGGVAKVSQAMANSPQVSMDAQGVAQAVADTVQPPPKK